jgi:hypothetical protein
MDIWSVVAATLEKNVETVTQTARFEEDNVSPL